MKIQLHNVGKRYNREWIFRKINFEFTPSQGYAILGANGSGKSTLLQVIAGNLLPSEGKVDYHWKDKPVEDEKIFRHITFASPYLELPEEMTLSEIIDFQCKFKSLPKAINKSEMPELLQLHTASNKPLKYFSSGMKQRLKLGLAILSESPLLLLDEPLSNLDQKGARWYQDMISEYKKDRTIIVCSNQVEHEYFFCNKTVVIEDYK